MIVLLMLSLMLHSKWSKEVGVNIHPQLLASREGKEPQHVFNYEKHNDKCEDNSFLALMAQWRLLVATVISDECIFNHV